MENFDSKSRQKITKVQRICKFFASLSVFLLLSLEGVLPSNVHHDNARQSSCMDAMTQCRRDAACKRAAKDVHTRCQVKSGRCNARSRDLNACAEIMDALSRSVFPPHRKCTCPVTKKHKGRCEILHEAIYENPCFRSVRYLRKVNMMPVLAEGVRMTSSSTKPPTMTSRGVTSLNLLKLFFPDDVTTRATTSEDDVTTFRNAHKTRKDHATEDDGKQRDTSSMTSSPAYRDDDVISLADLKRELTNLFYTVIIGTTMFSLVIIVIGISVVIVLSFQVRKIKAKIRKLTSMTH